MSYDVNDLDFTISLVGDVLLTRRMNVFAEDGFLKLRDLLHSSHATFANLETTVRHWDEGAPALGGLGTFMTMPPKLLGELDWFGIEIVSCANNHAPDFGTEGLLATIRHLDEAGIEHAGIGANLAEARAPAYLDTAAGRLAMVAVTATYRPGSEAGEQRRDMQGRPGLSALGFDVTYTVDPQSFAELKRTAAGLGFEKEKQRSKSYYGSKDLVRDQETAEEVRIAGNRFVLGAAFSRTTTANARHAQQMIKSIEEARRQADIVCVSVHYHELGGKSRLSAGSREEIDEPAEFIVDFARAAIDSGADMVVGHGPHYPLGIEIYKGRPIFYSIGNFVMQTETVRYLPDESYSRLGLPADATPADFVDGRTDRGKKGHAAHPLYWESIVVACRFRHGKPSEIVLHPIDLGHGEPRSQKGRPILATGATAQRILERMRRLSTQYGTNIEITGETAIVSLAG